jgi:O-antigen/teichoic acid export membrane protein
LVLIAVILVPLGAFNQLGASILRGLHWVVLADVPELLVRPITMLLLLFGTYLIATRVEAVHALGMQLAASSLVLVVVAWLLAIKQPAPLKTATPEPPRGAWLLGALPFLGFAIIGVLEGQVSLYLLGYLGGVEQAGLFQAANQLVGLIVLGLVAVNLPLQPALAAAWARGDKQQAQRLVTETARIGTSVALMGVLVLLIFAEFVLRLYGAQYVDGQMVNAAAGSCGILLLMTGHQIVVMQGTALALLLNAAVAYLAIPCLGVAGGALAAALGVIFWNVYFVVFTLNRLGVNTTIFHYERR